MLGFDLTPLALADLKEIGRYTEDRWGRLQRDRYLNQLDGAFRKIATNPSLGRKRDDLRAGYRSCVRNQHVVFYRIRQDRIEILRVLHQRMDVESEL